MIDNVLQSFCERCGRRFTQPAPAEHPAPAPGILGRLRRRPDAATPDPDAASLPVAEAFRDTFHFCLECRRYNCIDCWNVDEGHCLSCRPIVTPASAPAPGLAPGGPATRAATMAAATHAPADAALVWPSDDLQRQPGSGAAATFPAAPVSPAAPGPPAAATSPAAPVASASHGTFPPEPDRASSDSAPDLPWGPPTEALDPWRGVVFSVDEVDRSGRTPGSSAPVVAPAVPATPEVVTPAAWHTAAPGPAAPGEEVGVLASLIESEPHVDAAGWARASSAVVGLGSLKAATGAEPAGAPEDTLAEQVIAQPEPSAVADVDDAAAGPVAAEEAPAVEEPQAVGSTAVEERQTDVEAPTSDEAQATEPSPAAEEPETAAEEPETADVPDGAAGWIASDEPEQVEQLEALASAEESLEVPSSHPEDRPAAVPTPEPAESYLPESAPPEPQELAAGAEPSMPTPVAAEPVVELADDLGPLDTPRPSAPLAPLPGLEVWVTPAEQGPFAQPYQPSPPQATVYPADMGRVATPAEPALPTPPAPAVATPAAAPEPSAMPPQAPAFTPGPNVAPIPPNVVRPPAPLPAAPPPAGFAPSAPPLPPAPGWQPPFPASPPAPPVARPPAAPARPTAAGSRACPNCALPLSTKARFCRRCGAPQPA